MLNKDSFKEFDEKVKKAVEAINAMSKSIENAEKAAEEAKKEAAAALKKKLNTNKPSVNNPKLNSYEWLSASYYADNSMEWPVSEPLSQQFGTYHHPYKKELDWMESTDEEFNDKLIHSIKILYAESHKNPKDYLLGKKGKEGECFVFNSPPAEPKAYAWSEYFQSWIKVPYDLLLDYWNGKKLDYQDPWDNYGGLYNSAYTAPQVNYYKAAKVKFTPVNDNWEDIGFTSNTVSFGKSDLSDSIKAYYTKVVKKFVKQKTKPSNPQEGLLWCNYNDDWSLYTSKTWVGIQSADKAICKAVVDQLGKKPTVNETVPKSTGSGLHFRGNCSKWHEILNPEKTVIESVNKKHKWFISNEPAQHEYDCGHDFKRIMPVFTDEEKAEKIKEIANKQNGDIDESFYIQVGKGQKASWTEVHAKQTITIGGRAFHHNSGNKTWYMCLSFSEMKFVKMPAADISSAPWIKDTEHIFMDAFPVGKFGFAWFYDGTVESAKNNAEHEKEMILDNVQEIANNLNYQNNTATNKKKEKDMKQPTKSSDYQMDHDDYLNYMSVFDHIYSDVYSFGQFKNKAVSMHKYLMHDLKLAMLKKNKKKVEELLESLDNLQDKFNEAEQYHVLQNKSGGLYLKPLSKVQNLFNYHFKNDYGVPD